MTRRLAWWTTVLLVGGTAVVGGLAAGCSNDPPPIQEAKKLGGEEQKGADLTPGKAPDKSDPEAAAVVAAALAAHTGGKPEKLQPLRSVTFTRTGPATFGGPFPVEQKWVCHGGWPNRFRVKAEVPGQPVITLAWSGSAGWSHTAATGKKAMTPQEVKDFEEDVTGDWLTLVFPLAEPNAVFMPSGERTVNNKPAVGVRVWHPALSDAVAYFDKESKLLALVTFSGREGGRRVTKEIAVFASRSFDGVTLPEKTFVRSSGNLYAEWTLASLQPVASLDAKLFEEP